MSKYPPSVVIAGYLLQAGIYTDNKQRRLGLAGKIADTNKPFDQYTLDRLMKLARSQGGGGVVGSTDQYETVAHWLENHEWIDIDLKLRDERDAAFKAADEKRLIDADSSSLEAVGPTNPYGWTKPEPKRYLDHDIPGKWNAFRQCYNMEAHERGENQDHRYRGCTRSQVMGEWSGEIGWRPGKPIKNFQASKPSVHYDPLAVEKALGQDHGTAPPGDAKEHKVYGE
jgi:hypothetical protein